MERILQIKAPSGTPNINSDKHKFSLNDLNENKIIENNIIHDLFNVNLLETSLLFYDI
jgi:hypothetical protein